MATIFVLDGFEHGRDVSSTTGVCDVVASDPNIVTTPVRTGARALEIATSASSENYGYTIAAGNRVVTLAFYVRFASLPTTNVVLAHFLNAAGEGQIRFMGAASDKFNALVVGGGNADAANTVAVDTWYRIVVEYDTSTTTANLRLTVDNGTEAAATKAIAATDTTSARLGTSNADTFTAYYDDWLISVTNGDYEEIDGWTSHRVESLIPNSDGTHNITTSGDFDSFTGTAFSNSTTNGNTFIGHRPLQAANTADQVIRQELGTTANYMEFGNENLSANTDPVDAVRTYATHVESSTTGASLAEARLLLADNTEVLTTGSLSAINSTEDPGTTVTIRKRMTIAPSGGWDGTKVDGLKWRIGFGDNNPDVNFIDLMVEVAQHVPAAAGTALQPVVIVAGL
jgi:hypothetical protein